MFINNRNCFLTNHVNDLSDSSKKSSLVRRKSTKEKIEYIMSNKRKGKQFPSNYDPQDQIRNFSDYFQFNTMQLENNLTDEQIKQRSKEVMRKPILSRSNEDMNILAKFVLSIPFFAQIKQKNGMAIIWQTLPFLNIEQFQKDQIVFKINSIGEKLYIIQKGSAGVFILQKDNENRKLVEVNTLHAGSSFGEIALLDLASQRTATIKCQERSTLISIKKQYAIGLLKGDRQNLINKIQFLSSQQYYQQFSPRTSITTSFNFENISFQKGDKLLQEKEKIDFIYVILSGQVKLRAIPIIERKDALFFEPKNNKPEMRKLQFGNPLEDQEIDVGIISTGELVGLDDIENDVSYSHYSYICNSLECECLRISQVDFQFRIYSETNNPKGKEILSKIQQEKNIYHQKRLQFQNYFFQIQQENSSNSLSNNSSIIMNSNLININNNINNNSNKNQSVQKSMWANQNNSNNDLTKVKATDSTVKNNEMDQEKIINSQPKVPRINLNLCQKNLDNQESINSCQTEIGTRRPPISQFQLSMQDILNRQLSTESIDLVYKNTQRNSFKTPRVVGQHFSLNLSQVSEVNNKELRSSIDEGKEQNIDTQSSNKENEETPLPIQNRRYLKAQFLQLNNSTIFKNQYLSNNNNNHNNINSNNIDENNEEKNVNNITKNSFKNSGNFSKNQLHTSNLDQSGFVKRVSSKKEIEQVDEFIAWRDTQIKNLRNNSKETNCKDNFYFENLINNQDSKLLPAYLKKQLNLSINQIEARSESFQSKLITDRSKILSEIKLADTVSQPDFIIQNDETNNLSNFQSIKQLFQVQINQKASHHLESQDVIHVEQNLSLKFKNMKIKQTQKCQDLEQNSLNKSIFSQL